MEENETQDVRKGHDSIDPPRHGNEALVAGFQRVVDDAEDVLRVTTNYSAEGYAAARARFQDALAQARLRLADAQSHLTDKAQQATDVTQHYVIANPWKSLAIVGSVGVILGILMSRRS